MTKAITIFIATLFITVGSIAQSDAKHIPVANVRTMYGEKFNTADISNNGKPIVIVVWETFRRSCFQYFQALNEDLSDLKEETGVKVVAISIDSPRSASDVLPMMKARQWDFESYIDVNREFKLGMGVVSVPYTFILNGKGEVVWEKQGYLPGQETELYDLVRKVAKGEKIN